MFKIKINQRLFAFRNYGKSHIAVVALFKISRSIRISALFHSRGRFSEPLFKFSRSSISECEW